MIRLSNTDYYVIFTYLAVIAVLSILFRAKRFNHMFGEDKKPSWLLLAASLLMIEWSPMTDMMSMGLILENGCLKAASGWPVFPLFFTRLCGRG